MAVILLSTLKAVSQPINDLGMAGVSGVFLAPTIATMPESHFRADLTRMSVSGLNAGVINGVDVTGGLSPNIEFSVKYQSLATSTSISPSFIGIGGKFVLPFVLPFDSRSALWAETNSTQSADTTLFFPVAIVRGALVMQPAVLSRLNGTLLAGIARVNNVNRFLGGFNGAQAINAFLKIGGEFLYNYYGRNDRQESVNLLLRVHPNLCLQISPGYLQAASVSSWMVSFGITASTTGIEFIAPEKPKTKTEELPSFDDLEKQIKDEQKKEK